MQGRLPDQLIPEGLEAVSARVLEGGRISAEEAAALFTGADLLFLGYLANAVRERLHGERTTFSVNRHVNYSNICLNRCSFCAFRKEEGSPLARRITPGEIAGIVGELGDHPLLEVHITGGLDPEFTLEDAVETVRAIKRSRANAVVKAFTLVEVDHFARAAGVEPREAMRRLRDAGLSAFPGGGAEIFSDRVRAVICPDKMSGARWLELAETAHSEGIPTNATMLYGVGETARELAGHLERLRDLQDRTDGFMAFIPLLFQKEKTELKELGAVPLSGQLRVYAVSRIFLDNFPHIKVHWAMSGLKAAELSQWWGVDDVEGTVIEERIAHEGGASTPVGMTREMVSSVISAAGRTPVERDGLYLDASS